jgi:polyisoprenoid-binding protein YceI
VIEAGTHRFGPDNATLSVRTRRGGAAAKAGHDLTIRVTAWKGTLEVGEDAGAISAELAADASSLRVQKGTGGMQALGDDDKANIHQTIDDEVLKRQDIVFRSTRVEPAADGRLRMEGDLTLAGATQPIAFDLAVGDDGALSATVVVTQTRWGMKPYSALFGTLKVLDDVEVVLDGHL